jgi:hypothetical protein
MICKVFVASAMVLSYPIGLLGQAPQTIASVSVPHLVNVTGVYQPADGQPPPAGTVVTLLIYADQQGGAPLWQETQNVEFDKSGRFTLLLGATQADGIPLEVFGSGVAQWLALHFAGPGEVEGPRTRITSVPYALRSADADTLGGHPASAYLLAAGATTGKGAAATTAGQASANGNESSAPTAQNVMLSGTVNVLSKYVTAADVGPSAVSEAGGRVGINTGAALPADYLHVKFNDPFGAFTGLAVQNLSNSANAASGMLFYDQNGALAQFQGFGNVSHQYRIINIASGGTINFLIGGSSKFLVANNGDINISRNITKNGTLFLHSTGVRNTFLGSFAGLTLTTGINNTAVGEIALKAITTGAANTAVGYGALAFNVDGNLNTAVGQSALPQTTANNNTGIGGTALFSNTTGCCNAVIGAGALQNNTTGSSNVALGDLAGLNATTGSNNIYLGADVQGVADESNTMYLGLVGTQTQTFIAGVRGITTGAADAVSVVIDSNGQLGTINSSRRYKEDIEDMGDASSRLMQLRPVTYRYKQAYTDGTKPIDYGLIAEEVEQVNPDLVAHLADGEVETVQYQKINAMLLNEVQKQHAEIAALKARLDALELERR